MDGLFCKEDLWSEEDFKKGCFPGVQRVTFQHYRVPYFLVIDTGKPDNDMLYHYRKGVDTWHPGQFGGKTVCILTLEDGKRVAGEAVCSMADTFSYKYGRNLSFVRALNAAGIPNIPF